jgi:hypothetical protein
MNPATMYKILHETLAHRTFLCRVLCLVRHTFVRRSGFALLCYIVLYHITVIPVPQCFALPSAIHLNIPQHERHFRFRHRFVHYKCLADALIAICVYIEVGRNKHLQHYTQMP